MLTDGGASSSVIVAVAAALEIVPLIGEDNVTVNVSLSSSITSLISGIETVLELSPAAKVNVDEYALKSLP